MSYAVEKALRDALVGLTAGRVTPGLLPDRPVFPAITYSLVGSRPDKTLCGESTTTLYRYRVDVFAATQTECVQLAASVKAIMRRFVYFNTPESEIDGYEPDIKERRRMLDFEIIETVGIPPPGARRARTAVGA
jgi:hypothetical protein